MTAETALRLVEILDEFERLHELHPLSIEDVLELRALKADLRNLAVQLDDEQDEDGDIRPQTASEHIGDADAYRNPPPPPLTEEHIEASLDRTGDVDAYRAAKHVLESGRVFVVDEPVPAGSLPPDQLVYPKRDAL